MNIYLESRIWSDSFDFLKWQIDQSSEKDIKLYIASIGGNVDAGFAIANYIEGVNASGFKNISTHILSNADSIATVIFLAPEKNNRTIVESSTMFVHDPRFMEIYDVTSEVADKASEQLRVQEDRIANYYVKKIDNLNIDEARQLMKGDKTLSANDMLNYGIVTEVKQSFNIAAIKSKSINMSLFGKKEKAFVTTALKQGENEVQAVHRGGLEVNSELEAIGSVEAMNGEFISGDKKYTITNSTVTAVDPFVEEEEEEEMADVAEQIADAVAPILDMVEAMATKMEAMSGQKSTHKPARKNVNNSAKLSDQAEARKSSKNRQKERLAERADKISARMTNLKIT